MSVKDIWVMSVTTVLTAGMVWVWLVPVRARAEDETHMQQDPQVASFGMVSPTFEVRTPKLELEGCALHLTSDQSEYEPGQIPTLMLRASNATDQDIETEIHLVMERRSVASMISRSVSMPEWIWRDSKQIQLAAGQQATWMIEPGVEIEGGTVYSISLLSHNPDRVELGSYSRAIAPLAGAGVVEP